MWVLDKSEVLHRERKREQNCVRVHLWAAVSVGFKSKLTIFPQWNTALGRKKPFTVTAAEYVDRCIIPLHNAGVMEGRIFQQDNARVHTAKHTKTTIEKAGWSVVEGFPPYSPDLNPIEQVWALMNPRVATTHPRTLEELIQATQDVWDAMEQEELNRICRGWRKSLRECVGRGGKP
jgi:transposase